MIDKNLIELIGLILDRAEKCESKPLLVKEILNALTGAVECELITLQLGGPGDPVRCRAALSRAGGYIFQDISSPVVSARQAGGAIPDQSFPRIFPRGYWPSEISVRSEGRPALAIPFSFNQRAEGLLALGFSPASPPPSEELEWYGYVASFVGQTLTNWHALAALRERIKELSCLHGLTQLLGRPDTGLEEVLQGVAELLPQAWLYDQEASARIEYAGQEFLSREYRPGSQRQTAALMVNGAEVGRVEVSYASEMPGLDQNPFLEEEKILLDSVARQVAHYIERRLHEARNSEMMDRLRHADRLAMIGQLSASVAHEINEPLTSILGYAQLAAKSPDLPTQISSDIGKVVATSLHVREIIRKTLLYSRKIPPKASRVNLGEALKETLDLFEWRCRRQGISLDFTPGGQPLEILADTGQIRQIVTNLVVNAIQAMPEGGKLALKTGREGDWVRFSVVDTGPGMTAEVVDKIFIPFYSTKEAGRGTGLGLSVVRDIVAEMNGEIEVQSRPGAGTGIVVKFPKFPGEVRGAAKK